MEIASSLDTYRVGKLVGHDDGYRLYLCKQVSSGRQCLLQIATDVGCNGGLDRAAYVLKELKRRADELEEEYARLGTEKKRSLNYDLGFPELLDSFCCPQQGNRRVNILAFRCVEFVTSVVPLVNITEKNRWRIDLKTSVWILGKLLKLFVFTQNEKMSIGLVSGKNILIEPDKRYVMLFDLSAAQISPEAVPVETRRQEISQAARAVIVALGGNPETGFVPNDDDEPAFLEYSEYILRLARGSESSAPRAHQGLYGIADKYWAREFHPFTTFPL